MHRRQFIGFPLVGLTLPSAFIPDLDQRTGGGFKVPSGRDRNDTPVACLGGIFSCKVSAKDSAKGLSVFDATILENQSPLYHLHYEQDEWIYVLRGSFMVKIGKEMFVLKPGDSAFGPRKIPHTYIKTSDGEGQLLFVYQPAGSLEQFFKQAAGISPGQTQDWMALYKQHNMEVLGPGLNPG